MENYNFKNATAEEQKGFFELINKKRKEYDLPNVEAKPKPFSGSGIPLGATIELTGEIDLAYPIKNADGKVTGTYIALLTDKGKPVSLASLVGISNDKGYSTGTFKNQFNDEEGVQQSKTIVCETYEGFKFLPCFTSRKYLFDATDDLYELAFLISTTKISVKGKWKYWGEIGKQFEAKKESSPTSFEKYGKGYLRVMTAKNWQKL